MAELDRQRWSRIEAVYEHVLTLPAERRRQYLAEACRDDRMLEDEIFAMLAADETGGPLEIERLVTDKEAADPLIGTTTGAWRIVALLGRGGAGAVYRVERADGQYEQVAALKLLSPGVILADGAARLAVERQILARLVHPNIARLIDGGVTAAGMPYLVMEYVDGQPLTTYCDERGLPIEDRLQLFRVVCSAVQQAHRALVVHRDLKPSNIYVSRAGEVKLLDFGIAKLLEDDPLLQTPVTRTDLRRLTPAYAAPEQLRGEAVTTAADVYALGVVLYELLAGVRPHRIEELSPGEAEHAILEREPLPPSAVAPGRDAKRLKGDLDRICLMALRKEPERRYGSVEQFAADVERYLSGHPVIAQPDTAGYRMRRFARRNRASLAVAALFVILLSAFGVTSFIQAKQVAAERDRATLERDKARRVVRMVIELSRGANPDVVPNGSMQPLGKFLDAAEARLLAGLGDDAEASAAMKHTLGQMYRARKDLPRARRLLEESLAEARALRGADAPEAISVQIDLAGVLLILDEALPARALFEDALARCGRTIGEQHALTARALHGLGQTYKEPHAARPYLERALAIQRAVLEPADPRIAQTLNDLGILDRELRPREARARFEEALPLSGQADGAQNAVAITSLRNMATLAVREGDFARAETLHRRTVELATRLFGRETKPVALGHYNLGLVLANRDKVTEALAHFREAHEISLALVGETDARTANAARKVALSLLLLERPGEALPWMERALRAAEQMHGRDADETVSQRAQLAVIHSALGRHDEAIAALQLAVKKLETSAPAGNATLADTELHLGHALLDAGRAADAEGPYRASLARRERTLPRGHRQIAVAQCELARALSELGRDGEARPLLDACVPAIRGAGMFHDNCRQKIIRLHERLRVDR